MKKIIVGVIVAMSGVSNMAYGAIPNTLVQQEQLQSARQQAEDRAERLNTPKIQVEGSFLVSGETTSSTEVEPSFFIDRIVLLDVPHEFRFLEDTLESKQHMSMNVKDMNQLVEQLNQLLMDKGYVMSQVRLPEQNVRNGILRLQVIPGRLGNVIYAKDSFQVPWRTAFPIREGDILNIRRLEQGLEQMKRISSHDVSMALEPGDVPGVTNVVLTIKRTDKPVHAMVAVDNSGIEATGKWQLNMGLTFDETFTANDLLRINLGGDVSGYGEDHQSHQQSIAYSIGNGWDTYSISHSRFRYSQLVASRPFSFISSGRSMTTQLSWEHVYSRSQNERKAWDISVSKRNSHAYINGLEIPVQAMDTTALEFGVSDRIYIGDAIFYARLASKWGVSWFNTPTIKLDKDGPNTKYQMWLLDLDYRKPLELRHRPYTYTASFHGQWTKSGDRLYGTDQISMGNRYTVRSFDGEYTLMGESGWYLRQELATPVQDIAGDMYLGLDVGAVYGPSTDMLVGRTIAGATLGARGQFKSGIGYDVAIGTPIYKSQGYPTGKTHMDVLLHYKF